MANISGARNTETWNDGDIITGNVTVAAGQTITVAAGATIGVSGNYSITISGTFNSIGTYASRITFNSTVADPGLSAWSGIASGANGAVFNIQYTNIFNANWGFGLANHTQTVTWNNNWLDSCNAPFQSTSLNQTISVSLNTTLITNSGVVGILTSLGAPTVSASKFFLLNSNLIIYGSATAATTLDGFCIYGGVNTTGNAFSNVSTLLGTHTFSNGYIKAPLAYTSVAVGAGGATINFTKNVCHRNNYLGISVANANLTINSTYSDYIRIRGVAMGQVTAGTLTSDNDYVIGCNARPETLVDTTANTQVSGVGASFTRTNELSLPNKPLAADNVSESSLTANGVTIGFDCQAGVDVGGGALRLDAIPFVEYGVASGVYTQSTIDDFPDELEIGKCWTGISTKYAFAQTGHSVALVNLKEGTKYYYRCGIIDPLGRVGYSAEGDFTTTGAVSGNVGGFL